MFHQPSLVVLFILILTALQGAGLKQYLMAALYSIFLDV